MELFVYVQRGWTQLDMLGLSEWQAQAFLTVANEYYAALALRAAEQAALQQ